MPHSLPGDEPDLLANYFGANPGAPHYLSETNEFEGAVRLLAKLMSDAINEKEVQKLLPDKIDNEKGISKLERLLTAEAYPQVTGDIAYLRRVQELRSKVTAHLKGSDYEVALTKNLGHSHDSLSD